MKKRVELKNLIISSPCSEDFPQGDGTTSFCQRCQHDVYNLSSMDKETAENFLANLNGRKVCIDFLENPDGTVITQPTAIKTNTFRQAVRYSAALLTTFLSINAVAYAQNNPIDKLIAESSYQVNQQSINIESKFKSLSGVVKDEQGAVIGGVVIAVIDSNKQKVREVISNEDGYFKIDQLEQLNYSLRFSAEGFETTKINISDLTNLTKINITMKVTNSGIICDLPVTNSSEIINSTCNETTNAIPQNDKPRRKTGMYIPHKILEQRQQNTSTKKSK